VVLNTISLLLKSRERETDGKLKSKILKKGDIQQHASQLKNFANCASPPI